MTEEQDPFEGRSWKYWTRPEIVDVDGVPTAYRRAGSGETVVYLHGGGNTRAWLPFHAALAERFDVIAPEHPGFGDTPRRADMDRWSDWVLHYDSFFRALALEDGTIHLVGNSMGGQLAANIAIAYPERFASLTLLVPSGLRDPERPATDVFRWTPEEADEALFNGRGSRYGELLVQEGGLEDEIHAYQEETTSAILMWNPRYDIKLETRLSRIAAPTLCLGVDDDRVTGTDAPKHFADLIAGSRFELIPGRPGEPSSHLVFLEQPDDTAAAIAAHIDNHLSVRLAAANTGKDAR